MVKFNDLYVVNTRRCPKKHGTRITRITRISTGPYPSYPSYPNPRISPSALSAGDHQFAFAFTFTLINQPCGVVALYIGCLSGVYKPLIIPC